MADNKQLKLLKKGADVWNRWREKNPDTWIDLTGASLSSRDMTGVNLSEAHLSGIDLSGTDLSRANLSGSKLSGASFMGANLSQATLAWTNLSWANFTEADLQGANLRGADLRAAILRKVNLMGLDLSEVRLGSTTFGDVDLREVKGLTTIKHYGPSTVGLDTIYRSGGHIPDAFLRGVGSPDSFITYVTSLTANALEYYSCFISYSSKDQSFVERLHADLQSRGVRCWFAPEDMKIGDEIRSTIDQAICMRDKLLIVLSDHSINSTWVKKEIETAFEEEHRRGQATLFPVRLDDAVVETNQAWAADIRRTRHIGDFSRWKDYEEYEKAFERLLRDLKAEK